MKNKIYIISYLRLLDIDYGLILKVKIYKRDYFFMVMVILIIPFMLSVV